MRTLDPLKPPGTYKIDDHTGVLFPKVAENIIAVETLRAAQISEIDSRIKMSPKVINENIAVEATRAEVNRAAQIAELRARTESSDLRKAREHAELLLKLLKNIERDAAKWFPAGGAASAAATLSRGFTGSVVQPLVHIIGDIDSLRAWGAELQKQASIAPPPPSNSDPLARHFVRAMGIAYLARRKKQPPHGRAGPFVNLLVAAWADLGFQTPSPDTDLEDWLGRKAEKLPLLTTNKSSQKR